MADERINHNKIAAAHLAAALLQVGDYSKNPESAAELYCKCYEALIEEGKERPAPNAIFGKAGVL